MLISITIFTKYTASTPSVIFKPHYPYKKINGLSSIYSNRKQIWSGMRTVSSKNLQTRKFIYKIFISYFNSMFNVNNKSRNYWQKEFNLVVIDFWNFFICCKTFLLISIFIKAAKIIFYLDHILWTSKKMFRCCWPKHIICVKSNVNITIAQSNWT